VEATPKEKLVRLLQLTQRERRWKQSERDRCLVETRAHCIERRVEQRTLPRRERRHISQCKQAVLSTGWNRRALWNHTDERNGKLRLCRMTTSVAKRANLLEPCRFDMRSLGGDTTRCVEERLVSLRLIVRQPPPLASARFIRTNE
jgi:hypothetical protein